MLRRDKHEHIRHTNQAYKTRRNQVPRGRLDNYRRLFCDSRHQNYRRSDGNFIAMPSRKTPDGEYKDIAHPINTETRELIKTRVLEAYEKALREDENNA